MSEVTVSNFKTRLANVLKSVRSQRDSLQELLVFGMNHAKDHANDFTYLSLCVRSCIGVRALDTDLMKQYIFGHVSNVTWTKYKDGTHGFKKSSKGVECEYADIEWKWYEHEKEAAPKALYTEEKLRSAIVKGMKRLAEDQGITDPSVIASLVHEVADQAGDIVIKLDEAA